MSSLVTNGPKTRHSFFESWHRPFWSNTDASSLSLSYSQLSSITATMIVTPPGNSSGFKPTLAYWKRRESVAFHPWWVLKTSAKTKKTMLPKSVLCRAFFFLLSFFGDSNRIHHPPSTFHSWPLTPWLTAAWACSTLFYIVHAYRPPISSLVEIVPTKKIGDIKDLIKTNKIVDAL